MNQIKFYLYDENYSDCKGKDLSSYVAIGSAIKESLDGTIDTYAITLNGLPFREEIIPTTKFIYEIYSNDELQKTIDMVLQDDVVEQPILSDDTYFIHKLTLANAAVIAQQKMCDNMAFTYRLKDVDLTSQITIDTSTTIKVDKRDIDNTYSVISDTPKVDFTNFVHQVITTTNYAGNKLRYSQDYILYNLTWQQPIYSYDSLNGKYFRSGTKTVDSSGNGLEIKNLKANYVLSDTTTSTIKFTAPELMCWRGVYSSNNIFGVGALPYYLVIKRTSKSNGSVSYYDNKNKYWDTNYLTNLVSPIEQLTEALPTTPNEHLSLDEWAGSKYSSVSGIDNNGYLVQAYCSSSAVFDYNVIYTEYNTVKMGDFNTTSLSKISTEEEMISLNKIISFETSVDYQYSFECYPCYSGNFTYAFKNVYCIGQAVGVNMVNGYPITNYLSGTLQNMVSISTGDITYYSVSTATKKITQSSSTIPTCYDMLKKAVLTTYNARAVNNVQPLETTSYITLDSDVENKLRTTEIVETTLQDKNLWEVICEIGNYLHAKPYLTFDRDTKNGSLRLQFKEYGGTTISTSKGYKETIFNSRFLEEYISSLDCYASNLMQLGSTITECTFLQSESDDYLVYNDTACLLTKYPIAEIVKLEIMDNGSNVGVWRDITNYVFEYNIWKCLGLSDNETPYRGNSIYYHLYSNKIEGMQYLVPSVYKTTQYPIKLIISEIYGLPTTSNITFSDYSFRITYRTKSDLRVRTVRPDIRKYLANSNFENMPIHTQVSNQTAKIIDSEALGSKLYGELIRTGNSIYEKNIWSNTLEDVNNVGDLVKLEDENLYYISKVESQIYTDHIESNIEYTKDFNRLSQIIGIPSEPRFYEISEQSGIVRDVNIETPIIFFTNGNTDIKPFGVNGFTFEGCNYITPNEIALMMDWNFRYDRAELEFNDYSANFIDTTSNAYSTNLTIYNDVMWSVQNTTLTYTTKMEDNFMVANALGETSDTTAYAPNIFTMWDYLINGASSVKTQSYRTLEPVRYVDLFGKCDNVKATLRTSYLNSLDTFKETSSELSNIIRTNYLNASSVVAYNYSTANRLVLNKDNRETLRINWNFHCITDSDRICVSDQVWKMYEYLEDEKLSLVVFYDTEINKLSRYINSNDYEMKDFAIDELLYTDTLSSDESPYGKEQKVLYLDIGLMINSTMLETREIKSVALCKLINGRFTYFIGKNLTGLTTAEKAQNIFIDSGDFVKKTNETQLNNLLK